MRFCAAASWRRNTAWRMPSHHFSTIVSAAGTFCRSHAETSASSAGESEAMKALSDAGSSGSQLTFENSNENLRVWHLRESLAPILREKKIVAPPHCAKPEGKASQCRASAPAQRVHAQTPVLPTEGGSAGLCRAGAFQNLQERRRAGADALFTTSPRISGSCTRETVSANLRASCIFAPNEPQVRRLPSRARSNNQKNLAHSRHAFQTPLYPLAEPRNPDLHRAASRLRARSNCFATSASSERSAAFGPAASESKQRTTSSDKTLQDSRLILRKRCPLWRNHVRDSRFE